MATIGHKTTRSHPTKFQVEKIMRFMCNFSTIAKNPQTDLVAAFIIKKQNKDVKLGHSRMLLQ
jgi:hypothetical protein